jgi:predicted DNA-binding transcriptional regulator AlpA
MAERLIKYEEVAARLGMPRRGVELLVQRRAIPVVKLSKRCHRFRWSDVEAAVAKLTVKAIA